MRAKYGLDIALTDWKSFDVLAALWDQPHWHWDMIVPRPVGYGKLEVAIWLGQSLVGLAVATVLGPVVILRFVEGNPDVPDRLRGQRLAMVLEVAAVYAEKLGKTEIRMHLTSSKLIKHCVEQLGFEATEDGHFRLALGAST